MKKLFVLIICIGFMVGCAQFKGVKINWSETGRCGIAFAGCMAQNGVEIPADVKKDICKKSDANICEDVE